MTDSKQCFSQSLQSGEQSPDKRGNGIMFGRDNFSYFSIKTYFVTHH